MSVIGWIIIIMITIGGIYYLNDAYGYYLSSKKKEKYEEEEEEKEEKEAEDGEKKPVKKGRPKKKMICFGEKCISKKDLQKDLDEVDDDTREELFRMLYNK